MMDTSLILQKLGVASRRTSSLLDFHIAIAFLWFVLSFYVVAESVWTPPPQERCTKGVLDVASITCCPKICGACGGPGCENRPGGRLRCCGTSITNECNTSAGPPPCTYRLRWQPPQQVSPHTAMEMCTAGVIDDTGGVCCAASCGTCGGVGCGTRPGGGSSCCSTSIKRKCQNSEGPPPCIYTKDWTSPPPPDPDDSARSIGNPECWNNDFTFERCCKSPENFVQEGCNSFYFSFETCCTSLYRPQKKCMQAESVEEQLWHCRMRRHPEVDRCLRSPGFDGGGTTGVVGVFSKNHHDYVQSQRTKSMAEIDMEWTEQVERTAELISLYIKQHFVVGGVKSPVLQGVCHGAKTGKEVRMLRSKLQATRSFKHVSVVGTDITPEAAAMSDGDVVNFDFHVSNPLWLQKFDFVYSNAFDHAIDPGKALMTWRRSLFSSDSLLVLHRSSFHTRIHVDEFDVFGASLSDYCGLLNAAGYDILDIYRLPTRMHEDLIFAARGPNPHNLDKDPEFNISYEKLTS